MSQSKRLAELNELAAQYGFGPAERVNNGHLRFRHTRTGRSIFNSFTPSDHRADLNFRTKLRRLAREVNGS